MKLPVDTSAISFLCALAPEPVVDFETKRPRADENGEPLYMVQLIAMTDGAAEIIAVKVAGQPSTSIRQAAQATARPSSTATKWAAPSSGGEPGTRAQSSASNAGRDSISTGSR